MVFLLILYSIHSENLMRLRHCLENKRQTVNRIAVILLLTFIFFSKNIEAQELFTEVRTTGFGITNWGYNYDSTLVFLKSIKKNPFIKVDSIGRSVQGRAIWMITVKDTSLNFNPRYRVTLHARTHPSERQAQWITERMVEKLIGSGSVTTALRKSVIFNVIPMHNPDGVELNIARQNANLVDLERNWFTTPHEPEVKAVKDKFFEFMNSSLPIRVALNMHGAYANKGYFVFHHEKGTSAAFVQDQKRFISLIRANWPDEFADWNYFVSWADGTPLLYPESWFWINYKEAVMAITVEETYVASKYVSSIENKANALLYGLAGYLGLITSIEKLDSSLPNKFGLSQNYPNPFNASTVINYQISKATNVTLKVFDLLGREIATLVDEHKQPGNYSVEFRVKNDEYASGIYYYQLNSGYQMQTKKMILVK